MMTMKRTVQLSNMLGNSKRVSSTSSKPTMLKHYSKIWQSMLMLVKNNMRRHMALRHAFPECNNHLNKAKKFSSKPSLNTKNIHVLDDSKFFHCYILTDFVIL